MTTAVRTRTSGKVKPRRKGLAALLTHRTFRRLVQFGVFAFDEIKGWMTLDDVSAAYDCAGCRDSWRRSICRPTRRAARSSKRWKAIRSRVICGPG